MTATVRAGMVGAVGGFLLLHPLFMLLLFRDPSNQASLEHWLAPVLDSFRVEMFPMAAAFAIGGAALAVGSNWKRSESEPPGGANMPESSEPAADESPSELEVTRRRAVRYLAHDLKNGLGAILGYSGVLLQRERIGDSRATLTRLRAKSQEMIAHVRSFLDLELLGDRSAVSRVPVAVHVLLETAAAYEDPARGDSSIEIHPAVPGGLRVRADPVVLCRVLENLVANSIGHNPAPVHVRLSAERSPWGDDVVFTCADDGVGIPEHLRGRIFGEFSCGGAGSSGGSTGLGLAFCRHAVRDHGGRIWLETGADGTGASFCFTLPAGR